MKICGEGPSTLKKQTVSFPGGIEAIRPYTNKAIRYKKKDDKVYAFVMEHPDSYI